MLDSHLFDSAQSGRLATMGRLQGLTASKSVSLPGLLASSATFNRFARNQSINRSSEARIKTKSPNQVASLSRTAAGLLRAFLHAVGKPPASRKPLRRLGKAPPFNHCCPLAPSLSRGKASSQRRAARNARLSQSVFRCTPHRQPQTRRMESLRYTPLSVLSGLGAPCRRFLASATARSRPDLPRLRSAYLSLKRNIPLLWTFYEHPEIGLPNTNNGLEGLFSNLKTKVRVHSGIGKINRMKLIDEYIKRNC